MGKLYAIFSLLQPESGLQGTLDFMAAIVSKEPIWIIIAGWV